MDIDELKAGRELDALIAEKVMICEVEWKEGEPWYVVAPRPVHRFSTDETDAFYLLKDVEARDEGHRYWLHELSHQWENAWRCILAERAPGGVSKWHQSWGAETPSLAICRAILKAFSPSAALF